jgi:hypothetical protein
MDDAEQRKALKVPDVDRQQLRYAVDVHARRDPGIVNLNSPDFLGEKELPPTVMDVPALRQQLKIPFDYAGDTIRLADAQSKSVPFEGPGGSIPKFAENLRGETQACTMSNERLERIADGGVVRIVAFAHSQQDVGIE